MNPCFSASTGILPGGNEVDAVDETRALRTNLIWSKGCVEYTSLADTEQSDEPASENCGICGRKFSAFFCEINV